MHPTLHIILSRISMEKRKGKEKRRNGEKKIFLQRIFMEIKEIYRRSDVLIGIIHPTVTYCNMT